jgi:HD-GYP domain-containing protein (c-di-GMP phosphodiesterase class II)
MKKIPIQTLLPNSLVSATVFLDDQFILLTPETPVSETLLRLLRNWGYTQLQANEGLKVRARTEPVATDMPSGRLPDDSEEPSNREETQKFYSGILEFTHKLFDAFMKRNIVPIEPLTDQVKLLVNMMRSHKRHLLDLGGLDRGGFSYIVSHSVNVAILSVAVADTLKLPFHKMIEVGMAGLLHELGMFKLPDNFQTANRTLTEAEKRALLAHPLLGYRTLRDLGFPPNVTLAVLEHHEKEDGTGYPQGLTGDKIATSAKILAVASAYDAQTTSRPFRVARGGHASLLSMLQDIRKTYDEQILRRLVVTLSIFPIGTYVELKNGCLAVVFEPNPDDFKRPDIRLLTDESKSPLTSYPMLRLIETPELAIARALNSEELKQLRADRILPA